MPQEETGLRFEKGSLLRAMDRVLLLPKLFLALLFAIQCASVEVDLEDPSTWYLLDELPPLNDVFGVAGSAAPVSSPEEAQKQPAVATQTSSASSVGSSAQIPWSRQPMEVQLQPRLAATRTRKIGSTTPRQQSPGTTSGVVPLPRERYSDDGNGTSPSVCLAFLSCCGRTDLLEKTIAGAVRHMEQDEPDNLAYEIAWVDNGSGEELTSRVMDNFEIEHALPIGDNMGLVSDGNSCFLECSKAGRQAGIAFFWLQSMRLSSFSCDA